MTGGRIRAAVGRGQPCDSACRLLAEGFPSMPLCRSTASANDVGQRHMVVQSPDCSPTSRIRTGHRTSSSAHDGAEYVPLGWNEQQRQHHILATRREQSKLHSRAAVQTFLTPLKVIDSAFVGNRCPLATPRRAHGNALRLLAGEAVCLQNLAHSPVKVGQESAGKSAP